MSFKKKYIKYKNKYLDIKKLLGGCKTCNDPKCLNKELCVGKNTTHDMAAAESITKKNTTHGMAAAEPIANQTTTHDMSAAELIANQTTTGDDTTSMDDTMDRCSNIHIRMRDMQKEINARFKSKIILINKDKTIQPEKSIIYDIELQYLDIRLDLYLVNLHNKSGKIKISALSRGHFVADNPLLRIQHRPWATGEPKSCPGDGSIFLALTVLYCFKYLMPPLWTGDLSKWWSSKNGPCFLDDNCIKISEIEYHIDPFKFKQWADDTIQRNIVVV